MALLELVLGTKNKGKISELRALLSGINVQGLPASAPDVVEDGKTYRENAQKKAMEYQQLIGKPVLADDSGLEVDALDGAPGVDSAFFGGKDLSWPQRWDYVLSKMKGLPEAQRTARFRCVLCFADGKNPPVFFEGIAPGRILTSPKGEAGFGYDPIVYANELKMSFAEAPAEAKNRVSHRAKALQAFRTWLDHRGPQS